LNKHTSAETIKRCWIQTAGGAFYNDVTAQCVSTDTTIYVDLTAGTDTQSGATDAVKNYIHFTTTYGHVKGYLFSVALPDAMILLDGYNANDQNEPLIWPWYTG
jgi:hypothetical protein